MRVFSVRSRFVLLVLTKRWLFVEQLISNSCLQFVNRGEEKSIVLSLVYHCLPTLIRWFFWIAVCPWMVAIERELRIIELDPSFIHDGVPKRETVQSASASFGALSTARRAPTNRVKVLSFSFKPRWPFGVVLHGQESAREKRADICLHPLRRLRSSAEFAQPSAHINRPPHSQFSASVIDLRRMVSVYSIFSNVCFY